MGEKRQQVALVRAARTPEVFARPEMLRPVKMRSLRRRLLAWYDRHKRDLPWRRRADDAYAQLVAEFMLQQTQAATVGAYYERFLARFPAVVDLAGADLDEVLALWSGLGYYRRARNLHAAARQIVAEHDGRVPAEVEPLMALPGIGRYTAGAIASVAFGCRAPALDGNVIRVLTRLLAVEGDPAVPAVRQWLWQAAEALLPVSRCGDFNQALMEVGATVCTPKAPTCERCPLGPDCQARARGLTGELPVTARRPRIESISLVTAAVRCGAALLLVQRPETGLWAGLWELPSEPVAAGEAAASALRRLRTRLPPGTRLARRSANTVTRQLTHRRVSFHVYTGTCPAQGLVPDAISRAKWVEPRALGTVGVSSAFSAILESLSLPEPPGPRSGG